MWQITGKAGVLWNRSTNDSTHSVTVRKNNVNYYYLFNPIFLPSSLEHSMHGFPPSVFQSCDLGRELLTQDNSSIAGEQGFEQSPQTILPQWISVTNSKKESVAAKEWISLVYK